MDYTLDELKTLVGERIGKTDAVFLSKIEDWINGRYDQIQKAILNKSLVRTGTVASVAGQDWIALPQECAALLSIHNRTNNRTLTPLSAQMGSRLYPDTIDQSAVPDSYWIEETSVLNQPSSAATITAVSSSALDTSQTVRVRGRTVNGENVASGTLNGVSTVNTLASCTQVDQVSKDSATVGFVTFLDGSVTIAVIYPRNKTAKYKKLHFLSVPDASIDYNIVYKRSTHRLEFAEDIPVLDCWNALVHGAYADALRQQRRFTQAEVIEDKFKDLVADMLFEQVGQAEHVERTIPHIQDVDIDQGVTFGA